MRTMGLAAFLLLASICRTDGRENLGGEVASQVPGHLHQTVRIGNHLDFEPLLSMIALCRPKKVSIVDPNANEKSALSLLKFPCLFESDLDTAHVERHPRSDKRGSNFLRKIVLPINQSWICPYVNQTSSYLNALYTGWGISKVDKFYFYEKSKLTWRSVFIFYQGGSDIYIIRKNIASSGHIVAIGCGTRSAAGFPCSPGVGNKSSYERKEPKDGPAEAARAYFVGLLGEPCSVMSGRARLACRLDSAPLSTQIGILAILGFTAVGAVSAGLTRVLVAGRKRWVGVCLLGLGAAAWVIAASIVWPS